LKRVSRAHEITLLTLVHGSTESDELTRLAVALPELEIRALHVLSRRHPVVRLRALAHTAMAAVPYPWAPYRVNAFARMVSGELSAGDYALVHCDQIQVAYTQFGRGAPPRLLTAHNVESRLVTRLAALDAPHWPGPVLSWQARKVLAAETQALSAFDACIAVSGTDGEALQALAPPLRVAVVPNGVDLEGFRETPVDPSSHILAFCGAMDWAPNADAAAFFAREVLPRIRQSQPQVQFQIIGRNPPASLVRRLTSEAVQFSGTVADVRPYLAAARLVVVPLRSGSGTRLKILEAWAMGRPVLSTTLGAEGLPADDGTNIAIADDAESMAARAVSLLADLSESRRLGAAGRRLVAGHFGWDAVARRLLEVYDDTAGRAGMPDDVRRSPATWRQSA
jgi:glycosyltransferase involved in cell wall biosynthesis